MSDAKQILIEAGASPDSIRVEEYLPGEWLVAVPEWGMSGCTSRKDKAFDTPQELAAHFVALRSAPLADAGEAVEELQDEAASEPNAEPADDAGTDAGAGGDGQCGPAVIPDPVLDEPAPAIASEQRDAAAESAGVDHPGLAPSYPGIAIARDELEDLRNDVLGAIGREEMARLAKYEDPTWTQDYNSAFTAYNNWPAGTLIPEHIQWNYDRVCAEANKEREISKYARQLKTSALTGQRDMLHSILAGLESGWP